MHKYLAEALGTFLLVFLGTLAVSSSQGDVLGVSLVFGVTLAFLVALIGPVSGGHFNPAVSLGAWLRGALSTSDIVPYWIAQFFGAIAASFLLFLHVGKGQPLGETVFVHLPFSHAFLLEMVLTSFFVSVILTVSAQRTMAVHKKALLIGGTLFILHLIAMPLTGAGLNPARSIAPVMIGADPLAAKELWVYVVGQFLGGAFAGVVARFSS